MPSSKAIVEEEKNCLAVSNKFEKGNSENPDTFGVPERSAGDGARTLLPNASCNA
jgi:hypothetical protein